MKTQLTQAELFRKENAITKRHNGWLQEYIEVQPNAEQIFNHNCVGWRFNDGSELYEEGNYLFTQNPKPRPRVNKSNN